MLLYIKGCKRSFFFARKVRLRGLTAADFDRKRGNGARSEQAEGRAGIKQTAHNVGGSACVQGLHYHALSANREIITQQRTRRHTLSVLK